MRIFKHCFDMSDSTMRGGMLIELLMSIALATLVITFVFQYQQNAVVRAQNIAVTRQMSVVQSALERYITTNRTDLLKTIGRNIIRLKTKDLVPYGLPDEVVQNGDKYQLRILKSNELNGRVTLQGVVILTDNEITPLRTREIVSMGGVDMGFIDGERAYGTFGTWRADTIDLGTNLKSGIIGRTSINRDNDLYLWRVPSDKAQDATMMTALNLGGHDIDNIDSIAIGNLRLSETYNAKAIAANDVIFTNRTTIDDVFQVQSANVSGGLSSDSRSMEISGSLQLSELGKFSSVTTENLWASQMTLEGMSVSAGSEVPVLSVSGTLDMTIGRISSNVVTVGYSGSVTPKLIIEKRITDSRNSNYYWDGSTKDARLVDAIFLNLNTMATKAINIGGGRATTAYKIFNKVAVNKNATAADYMNAINDIQQSVREKYRLLNLE